MKDNLPPLPESFCYKNDGTCWPDTFSAGQMKAYARAAIERQSVPEAAHTKYLEEIYGYLCSTSPKGYADEAFRNVPDSILPDSVRNRLAEQAPSMGEDARAIPEHAGSQESTDGRDGKTVAARAAIERQSAAPQPQPQPVQQDRIADLEAANAELLAALKMNAQALSWLAFGECRGFTDNLPTALEATGAASAAIKKHGGAA